MQVYKHRADTLNECSNRTRNGKLTACRMRFSFSVCSICFSFTTWKTRENELQHTDTHLSSADSSESGLPSVCRGSSWQNAGLILCAWLAWLVQTSRCLESSTSQNGPEMQYSEQQNKEKQKMNIFGKVIVIFFKDKFDCSCMVYLEQSNLHDWVFPLLSDYVH